MKKNTKKMPQKEYKSVAKLVTIAPTIEEIQADWKRSNRATKHSLVMPLKV